MVLNSLGDSLFQRIYKHKKGHLWMDIPLVGRERMHSYGSKHLAIYHKEMVDAFGDDYFAMQYHISKLYGCIFGSRITELVKTPRLIANMLAVVVKNFGWGRIDVKQAKYKENWLTFEFYNLPESREYSKFYGKSEIPLDYISAGLVSGSAEQLLKRKFITVETTCIAKGDGICTFETLSENNFKKFIKKIDNERQVNILNKILEKEKKFDYVKESNKLLKNIDRNFELKEADYLRREQIY